MTVRTSQKSLLCICFLLLGNNANAFLPSTTPSVHRTSKMSLSTNDNDESVVSRRDAIMKGIAASLVIGSSQSTANAFENKISDKYDDRPKRRGPQPKDLGVATRKDMVGEPYTGLKPCGPAPNCFCSTDAIEDDPEHNIPPLSYPKDLSKEAAFTELAEVVQAYKPGQGNIDGGGFKVVKLDTAGGYMYVQFESLKNGYIDDVEFAYIDGLGDNAVQVRSSSRVGYLDFGVNAKRLNYIAKGLKAKGWDAVGVDFKVHPDYAMQNSVS